MVLTVVRWIISIGTGLAIDYGFSEVTAEHLQQMPRPLVGVILILLHGCIFYFFYHLQAEVTYIYLLLTRVFPNTLYSFMIGLLLSFFMRSNLKSI